jgi:type I restriction enzyme S subunit
MNYPLKRLEELCHIIIGRTPSRGEPSYWGKGNKWVSISDLDGKIIRSTKEEITDHAVRSARCRRITRGTLLFSFKLTIGKMAFAGEDLFTNEAIAALEVKDPNALSASYLFYALQSAKVGGSNQAAKGKTLNSKSLAEIEIPLPSLHDQIRIAHLLGKVEGLITQRKQQVQQLDDLLKSVFLELFGDPVRNEKGWATGSLSTYGSFKNGLNFGKGESGTRVRYLGVGDFKARAKMDDIKSLSYIELNSLPSNDYFLQDGDLVFVRSNGNRELVGRCMAVYPGTEKVTYSGFCIRYRISEPDLQSTYIAHLFRSTAFRRTLFRGGQGANIQNINQQVLSELLVPLPPEDLQKQFAASVETVENLKERYRQSLTDLEALYGVVSQQTFKGELDLLRVPLPDAEFAEPQTDMPITSPSPADQPIAIHLPDTELLQAAVDDRTRLKELLPFWLEAYRAQLDDTVFSAQVFLAAAQTRITELYPDVDFELGADSYETVKTWVFEALASGSLTQGYVDDDNRVMLAATSA